jgi:hypothetical protein
LAHGHTNYYWTEGRPAVNIRNEEGSLLIFLTDIVPENNRSFVKDTHLRYSNTEKDDLFYDLKKAISKEDMEKLKIISAKIKDSNMQYEFISKFIAEIDMMLNHCRFDKALKIVPQIESECTSHIKAC